MTALLCIGLGLMELNRSYSQLEKELIAECLDVANAGREGHSLERVMGFLVIIQASAFFAYMGDTQLSRGEK